MALKTVKRLRNLSGKRVFVRVDVNVPIAQGRVLDDTKLRASLSTIQHLQSCKAKIILIGHLGRPEGRRVSAFSLAPIAKHLSELLDQPVDLIDALPVGDASWNKEALECQLDQMKQKQVVILENIRFCGKEKGNKGTFAKEMASFADVFVLDGFGVAHRADASVVGLAKHLPSYAGLLLVHEMKTLEKILKKPTSPFVLILGGAKVETKVPIIKHLVGKADIVLLAGGVANTAFLGLGHEVGGSLVDTNLAKMAAQFAKNKKVHLPSDIVAGKKDGSESVIIGITKKSSICKRGQKILDIGPATIAQYRDMISSAKTIVWNGALGYFEQKPYDRGTYTIARAIGHRAKERGVFSVIGGGETIEAMMHVKKTESISHVSTGGGAMLAFLAGETLPGIDALG